ncbi:MAG: DUF1553 domain-containing protein [Gemmataceae bacterium]|nr:DUF1553 domain-containing protein [Gemmataceae bacterium]
MNTILLTAALLLPGQPSLQIQPPAVTLTGPQATQRLIVLRAENNEIVGDITPRAEFFSSNPKVATVDETGVVKAIGDGETNISAAHDDMRAVVRVKVEKTREASTVSFANHVIPLLTKVGCNSGACHGALAGKGGMKLSLRGYDPDADHFVLTRQAGARRVNRQEPARSLMLMKPTLALPHGGGLKLDVKSPEFRVLADWIAEGAPGVSKTEAKIERIEAFPPRATLKPQDQLQVVVRAWYSDGHSEEVTRWARYGSTEDLVAGVDDLGLVKVAGHGEAAISVIFANQVALVRVASPFENNVKPKVYAQSPRHNFIDDLVVKKLAALKIPPSPQCSDSEFIRRAYLDAMGVLPSPDEVRKFTSDPRKDRRAKLIDAIVQRPEFVDYWTYRWSDLLLISSRKLPQPAMRAFYQFVRQSVADDKPWDRFARDILTVRGNTLQNGQANYFMLHKDISVLSETTALTFMGMSIMCARCHNHPLEKWTQDQYWGMANLFSQIAIKNGERAGEFSIQSTGEGDVAHPRRGIAMAPTPLDGKPHAGAKDRREYFADWLTAPDNPYFSKALSNRVWRNFLGRGLVEAEDDLRQTNPASNEELLDALARDFVKNKYDIKHLIRSIMNSAAYQRSAMPQAANKGDDRYYSRYLIRRLPAEVVLDAYSDFTKVPTAFTKVAVGSSGGDAATADYPLGTRALQLPDTQLVSQFLDAFGRPERGQTCSCERQQESSVTQALHLNNGQTLNDKLRSKKSRVEEWLNEKVGDDEAILRVFSLALSRAPNDAELARFRKLMAESARDPQVGRREVLEDLCWSVLTSREFLFNR